MDQILQALILSFGVLIIAILAAIFYQRVDLHKILPKKEDLISIFRVDKEELFKGNADAYAFYHICVYMMKVVGFAGIPVAITLCIVFYYEGTDIKNDWWLQMSLLNVDYVTDLSYLLFGSYHLIKFAAIYFKGDIQKKISEFRYKLIDIRKVIILFNEPFEIELYHYLDVVVGKGNYEEISMETLINTIDTDKFNSIDYKPDELMQNESDWFKEDDDKLPTSRPLYDETTQCSKCTYKLLKRLLKPFRNKKYKYRFIYLKNEKDVTFLTKNPLDHRNKEFFAELVPHIYNLNMNNLNLENHNRKKLANFFFLLASLFWIWFSSVVTNFTSDISHVGPVFGGLILTICSSMIPYIIQYVSENFKNENDHGNVQIYIFIIYTLFNMSFVIASTALSHYALNIAESWLHTYKFFYDSIDSIPKSGKLYNSMIFNRTFIGNFMEIFGINKLMNQYMNKTNVRIISFGYECPNLVMMSCMFFILNFNIPLLTFPIFTYFALTCFSHIYRFIVDKANISLRGNTNGDISDIFFKFVDICLYISHFFLIIYFAVDIYESRKQGAIVYRGYNHCFFLMIISLFIFHFFGSNYNKNNFAKRPGVIKIFGKDKF